MKTYTIYFEFYGKKMKTTVQAENREQAKNIIKNKVIFIQIDEKDETLDKLKNIFGI